MLSVPVRSKHGRINLAIIAFALIAIALIGATSAQAQPDNFGNGNGGSGAVTIGITGTSTTATPNTVAPVSGALAVGATGLTYGTKRTGTVAANTTGSVVADYAVGRLVMIYQSNGVASAPTAGSQTAYPLSSTTAGHWEFARVTALTATTLTFGNPLIYSYAAGTTQVIAVPEYTTMTLNNAGTAVTAPAWNGSSGGVLAILASGAITFNQAASINANAAGFRGGITYVESGSNDTGCLDTTMVSPSADGTYGMKGEGFYALAYALAEPATAIQQARGNSIHAGGGGNCFNAGGGGGGNGGQGGRGGNSLVGYTDGDQVVGGLGGAALTYSANNQFAMGGGGGGGERNNANNGRGGAGGGVVFVRGAALAGAGNLTANGAAGANGNLTSQPYDGAGGGGAGGVVYARFTGALACGSATANGGVGGSNNKGTFPYNSYYWTPGGGAAGGKTYLQGSSVSCTTHTAAGGANGTNTNNGNAYGATAGAAGTVTSNPTAFSLPTATVSAPAAASTTSPTPAAAGTATAGSTVSIYIDNVYSGVATLVGTAWSYSVPALAGGAHSITAYADVSGLASPAATNNFTVDATAPAAAVITVPAAATAYSSTATPTVSGTAEANSIVRLYDGAGTGTQIGSTTADGSGNWTIVTSTLTTGSHTVHAAARDVYGNIGADSNTKIIVIDTTAPTVVLTTPADGSVTNDITPAIAFSVTDTNAGSSTSCIIDGGTPFACISGSSLPTLTANAFHTLTIQHTDLAGNTGTSATNTFAVDTTVPVTPSISTPATSPFPTNDTTPLVTGTAEVNSTVKIYDGAGSGTLIGQTTADGGGDWTLSTNVLATGPHTVHVTSTDAAGNVSADSATKTLVIDQTAPTATITGPATNGTTVGPNGNLTFTTFDAVGPVTTTCQIDGTPAVSCTSPFAYSGLSAGAHSFTVVPTDAAGNVGAPVVRTFTVDSAPPNTTITANPAAVTNLTNASFSFSSTESPASFECVLDGDPIATCAVPKTYSGLGQASHTFSVRAIDQYGNTDLSPASYSWTIDTTAPIAPAISTPGSDLVTNDTTPTIGGSAEIGSTVRVYDGPGTGTQVGTAVVANGSGAWVLAPDPTLSEGVHNLHAVSTDPAGNDSADSLIRVITVDTVGPPPPSVSGPSGTVGSTSATINFNDLESPVTYMCRLDTGSFASCTDPASVSGLADGPHSYTVYAVDALGNAGSPTTINWTVDSSLFTAGITDGPLGTVGTSNNSLSFTATNIPGTTTFMCKIETTSFAPCASPYSTGVLADGTHTFSVYAVNGSQNSATVTRVWTIDTVGPVITISAPSNGQTVGPNGNVTFSATDTTGPITYTCQIDAGSATSCGSPYVHTSLTTGPHSVTIVATDAVSNSSTLVQNFTVDATPPNTAITANPALITNSTSASFSFTSTESPSTFECSLDGASPTTCSSGISLSSLGEASHTFSVRAIDEYGNVDQTPDSYTWTVDTTAPVAPSVNTPAGDLITTDTTPSVGGLAEPNSTVSVYQGATLVGTANADGSGVWALSPDPTFTEGPHALIARATDAAGNTSADSNTRTITIDTTPPVVSITSPIDGSVTNDNTPNIIFTATDTNLTLVQCSVDGGTPVNCTSPWTAPTLSDGIHVISVLAADATGTQQTVDSVTFAVDTTAPADPDIDTPPADLSTTDLRPTISGSAEPGSTVKIYDDATQIGSTTADVNGDWTFTPTSDLSESAHPLHVTATDEAGNTSGNSNVRTVTIDLTDPDAPVITSPTSDVTTSSVRPPISGTAEATSTVTVYDGATSIGTATADGSGNWTFTPTSDLSESAHPLHVTATDEAGNTSGNSNVRTVTIDLTAPAAPAITTPATDITTAVNTQAIGGTAEPGSTVSVYDGATPLGTATTNGSGVWSLSPDPTFSQGIHILMAYAADAAGNISNASPSRTLTIDNTAPDQPSITSPNPGVTTSDTTPTVSGVAEPGSDVDVYDGAALICSATANGSGTWSCTPVTALSDGDHTLTAKATDSSGNESDASGPVTITVDTTAPDVSISSPANGSTVATGNPPLTFTATDGNLDFTECKIDSSNFVVCASGDVMTGLLDGSHTATVRATDKGGNFATSATTFTVDTTAPTTTIGTKPGATDDDTTPTFTFTANDGDATFECRILPAAFAPCTSPFTSPTTLTDGSHTFEVRAADTHGNVEAPAKSHTWTVDSTPPSKPIVTAPVASSTTNDDTPTISGTAEPNSSVQVFVDGNPIGTVTANGSGGWAINATHLNDGTHSATARATDGSGNVGLISDPQAFDVDTTPPDGSVAEVPGSGGPGKTPSFDISTADGTATIRCAIDGGASSPCSAPFTPSGALAPGTHALVVTFTDPTGNVTTRTITFVIASIPVAPPPDDPTQCLGGGVVITNLFPKGSKATVSGFARADLVGKPVTITYLATKKTVASAVVKSDGSFTTTFKAPPKKDWNKNTTIYQASSGAFKSKKTKLLRRTSSTVVSYSGGKLTVSGTVTLPLVKGGGATIKAKTGCTGTWKVIGTTNFKANGNFSFTTPYAGSGVIFVQVNAVIGNPSVKNKKFKTNSFVVPVVVK